MGANCTGPNCGAPVRWILTVGGRRMPLDLEPSLDGNIVPHTMPDGTVRGRVLTGDELPALDPCWVPHTRTCPDSGDFRRRQAATTPKCRAGCGIPLDPWLVKTGARYHVNCEPPDLREHVETAREQASRQQTAIDEGGGT